MDSRRSTHPGEILIEEFLKPLGASQRELADHIGVPIQRVNEIVRPRRGVSPATAWLLAAALDTTPDFRMNLQSLHDLARSRPRKSVERLRRTA